MRFSFGISTPRSRAMIVSRLDSALALFVARVLADDSDHTLPPDDAAGFADALDGGTDLHVFGENKPAPATQGGEPGCLTRFLPPASPKWRIFSTGGPAGDARGSGVTSSARGSVQ